jgi:hypothetical protein
MIKIASCVLGVLSARLNNSLKSCFLVPKSGEYFLGRDGVQIRLDIPLEVVEAPALCSAEALLDGAKEVEVTECEIRRIRKMEHSSGFFNAIKSVDDLEL